MSNFTKESRAGMSQIEVSEAKKKPDENPCPNLTTTPTRICADGSNNGGVVTWMQWKLQLVAECYQYHL